MVSTWTASASDSSRRLRSSSPVSSPASAIWRRSQPVSAVTPACSAVAASCSSCATWRRSVSRRSPSCVRSRRSGRPSTSVTVSASAATPRVRSSRAHACRRRCNSSSASSSAAASSCAVQPRKGVSAAARGPRRVRRPLERLQQPQPVPRGRRAEDAARAVDDRRDAGRLQRVADQRGVAVRADEHGDVPGADARARRATAPASSRTSIRAPGRQQAGEVGREVGGDVLARGGVADAAAPRALEPRVVAVHDADAQRHGLRRARSGAARRWRAPPGRAGRRSPRARAGRRRTARRRHPGGPGRCAS